MGDFILLRAVIVTTLLSTSIASSAIAEGSSYAVIGNQSVPSTVLLQSDVRLIFSRSVRAWKNGSPIVVYTLDSSDEIHKEFTKSAMNLYAYQLDRVWSNRRYSGGSDAPMRVKDLNEMVAYVAATPGAIGYVLKEKTVDLDARVKVLEVGK